MDIKAITVYCGSSNFLSPVYQNEAKRLGCYLANMGIKLVFGGGSVGLMGIVADSVMANGGYVTGIIPHHLLSLEARHSGISELHVVDSMHTRKKMMFEMGDAFIVLPGGFGTLDEVCEILTWRQIRLHDKPIVFINTDNYWNPFMALIEQMVREKFMRPDNLDFFRLVPDTEAALLSLSLAPDPKLEAVCAWV